MDTSLEKSRENAVGAVVELGDGFFVGDVVNAGDGDFFVFLERPEEVFGLLDEFFSIGGGIIWDDDEERFVHDVSFLGKNVDKVDVIIHEDAKKHVVVVAANVGELVDVGANIDALRADEDLGGEVDGVEEILERKLNSFALGVGHEVEVDGFAGDDGAERTVFHDDETVADLGNRDGSLGGNGDVRSSLGRKSDGCGRIGRHLLGLILGLLWVHFPP